MERDILLDNFASLTVRQAIRFPLVGERPKPPKNPDGCFRLPSKVRQTLRRNYRGTASAHRVGPGDGRGPFHGPLHRPKLPRAARPP